MTDYRPYDVVWEITWKCNAKCIHCGSDCVSIEKQNQLSTAECLEIIRDLKRINTRKVTLSGGDPLLRPDFPTLAFAIKSLGMNVAIITNALALDDEKIKIIKEIKPRSFGISLDAGDEWMHDYIRGHKGCFNHALESIIKLKENGVEPSVITTTHKLNFPQLPVLRDVLIALGVKAWQIQYADFIGRMKTDSMITEAQFYKQAQFIYETQKLMGYNMYITGADVTGYMNDLTKKIGLGHWQGCHAGMRCLGLGSDGTVRGCLSQQLDKYIEGNIRERSLYEIWNDPKSFEYNRCFDVNTLTGYCKDCEYGEICKGGCIRSASKDCSSRCNKYCLHRIDEIGYSDEYQAKTYFSKEEIAEIYNEVKPLPDEFYNEYEPYTDILNH